MIGMIIILVLFDLVIVFNLIFLFSFGVFNIE